MTDTTKPPHRPKSPGPARPLAGAGDKPRSRPAEKRDDHRRDESHRSRGAEPIPREDDARIAKVMARAGLCSRRDAETWIAAGRVAVNGKPIDSPALNVKAKDVVTVDGLPLPDREPTRLFMFHKPRGLVTTSRDPEGRPTIFEHLPEGLPRVVSVGRLDINTEGLMLLTNDGGLARVLELPSTGWLRRYRVRANGEIDQVRLDALKNGVTLDGIAYAGIEATLDRIQGSNAWLTMGLREGKNREIKRVLESLGLAVTRLIRISFGPFQLGDLAEGAVESVPARVLQDQLGPGLAAEAGVDIARAEEPRPRRAGRQAPVPVEAARPSRPSAPRAHVSALRAARDAAAQDGRQRIERGATADRKGRAIKVERVIPVRPVRTPTGNESRNARNFAAQPEEPGSGRRTAPRTTNDGAAQPTGRRERAGGFGDKPRGKRPGGLGDKPRGERPGGFGDKPRGERSGGFGDKPRGERAGGFGDKPRGERSGGFGDKPRGERSGGFGDKPRGEPAGERQPGAVRGKPGGRRGGFGSDRPATGRNRPIGGNRAPGAGGPGRGSRPPGTGRPGGKPRGSA